VGEGDCRDYRLPNLYVDAVDSGGCSSREMVKKLEMRHVEIKRGVLRFLEGGLLQYGSVEPAIVSVWNIVTVIQEIGR